MKAREIIDVMNKWAKPSLIDKWDNTGFQVGDEDLDVKKILIALDVDRKIVDKAINENFDMIITHHPLIFNPIKEVTNDSYIGKLLIDLIKSDIIVYNAHSNLDLTKGGVNDVLADKLRLRNIKDLNIVFSDEEYDYGYGRIGNIRELSLEDYIYVIKNNLDLDFLRVYGDIDRKISRVAICGGSGSDFIMDAYKMGAEVFITGDVKYHEGQLGHQLGMTIIDAGHYHTEKIILPVIREYLEKNLKGEVEIQVLCKSSLPEVIY